VAGRLERALRAWLEGRDTRELRKVLFAILALLDRSSPDFGPEIEG
jgi:hypothetical protein